jgi:uncharacterized RDD family membrane protein YckC
MEKLNQTVLLRLAAFIVDSLTMALLLMLPAALVSYVFLFLGGAMNSVSLVWYAATAVLALGMLFRDGYRGRSPGKRLLGLRLITRSNTPCGYGRSLIRNLPLLIPGLNLVELFMVLFSSQSLRTGDRLAGTAVSEE